MIGKIVVSGFSLLLVVGVIIGVIAAVKKNDGSVANMDITPHMKAVQQLCEPTTYKEVCTKTLGDINSTDPKHLIQGGILAISNSLTKAFNLSNDLIVKVKEGDKRTKTSLNDCKTLLSDAKEELHDILEKVSNATLKDLTLQSDEFRIWLSSIISYNELCVDGFEDSNQLKATVSDSTQKANELTDNILEMLGGMSKILSSFGLELNLPMPNSRKLLVEAKTGYPTWLSTADRKLLALKEPNMPKPNAVVAKDGSGQYKTITAAINAYPANLQGRYVIYVKAGIYNEDVKVPKKMPNIFMYGDGPRATVITGKKSFTSGINTFNSAPFGVDSDGFICRSMGFENTAGPDGHQAVALRVNSDMSVFYNCRMDGYQDTLLYQAKRQFYRNCVISGTIDFMFGYGAAIIQNSEIIVRKPNPNQFCTLTADGRKEKGQNTGLVIHNCRILPEEKLVPTRLITKTYLGRPWKQYSTTVVMESEMGDLIQPEGWKAWIGTQYLDTLFYAEYANTGPGSNTAGRIKWKTVHFLDRQGAQPFTTGTFLPQSGQWIAAAGVPFLSGFK
ncbi:pectinesterase-like [Euphorbia lathyris]|uniref:pectinesterase-like n=1 Tax=Euphorbia lathyris TaxID=212925 RepID=UPI003313C37F